MLVENKFIFIPLPRRASTSFVVTCLNNKLDLKYIQDIQTRQVKLLYENNENFDESYMRTYHLNAHTRLINLKNKFGESYPIIAIKRNNFESFISLYNHILDEILFVLGEFDVFEKVKNLNIYDILCFDKKDFKDGIDNIEMCKIFFKKNDLEKLFIDRYSLESAKRTFETLFVPASFYTNNDKNIIWFEMNNLAELENWVSKKLNIDFKLVKINSARNKNDMLKISDEVRIKYEEIYGDYDFVKELKTII